MAVPQSYIDDFICEAQSKTAELVFEASQALCLDDYDEFCELMEKSMDLSDFVEALESPYQCWSDSEIYQYIDYFRYRYSLACITLLFTTPLVRSLWCECSSSSGGGSGTADGDLNEIQKAGVGGLFVGSKLFSNADGDLELGNMTVAGTDRTITASGSETNIDINLAPKGSGVLEVAGNVTTSVGAGPALVDIAPGGAFNVNILPDKTATDTGLGTDGSGNPSIFRVGQEHTRFGNVTLYTPTNIRHLSDQNTGISFPGFDTLSLEVGGLSAMWLNESSGLAVNVGFNGNEFEEGDGVIYIEDANTNPVTNPSSGGILYVDGNALYYLGISGGAVDLSGNVSAGAINNVNVSDGSGGFNSTDISISGNLISSSASTDLSLTTGDVSRKINMTPQSGLVVTSNGSRLGSTTFPWGALNVDNIEIDGNDISSTDTNGDVTVSPDGSGNFVVQLDVGNFLFDSIDSKPGATFSNSGVGSNDDIVGTLSYVAGDSGGASTAYARIVGEITNATDASEQGRMKFKTIQSGSLADVMILDGPNIGFFGAAAVAQPSATNETAGFTQGADTWTFGSYYFSTPAATTLAAATPAKAAGTTTAGTLNGMTHSDNRLTIAAGQPTREYEIIAGLSVSKASGGATLSTVYVYKNGTVVAGSEIDRSVSNTSDIGALEVHCNVSLAAADYVEIWVETDNGDDLTLEKGNITLKPIGRTTEEMNFDSTFTGNVGTREYTVNDIVKHLKNLGLIASS